MGKKKREKTNDQNWSESFLIKSILAGITLLTSIVNLIIAITNLLNGQSLPAIIAFCFTVIFLGISIIAFSLRSVQKSNGIKTQKDYYEFVEKISGATHNILHRIRNSIYYMEKAYNTSSYVNAKEFEQDITQNVMQLLDCTADTFKNILGVDVRVCIKCLDYTKADEDDPSKMNMITFARSGYQNIFDIMKEHKSPIKIKDNTDFSEIVQSANNKRQRQYFYEKNLKEFDAKLKEKGDSYKNSNLMWEKDYITTIVCPIRLQLNAGDENGNLTYRLIGFLCIDSLDVEAFDNIYSDFCFDLFKGLADILYVFLDKFITYYNQILEERRENH